MRQARWVALAGIALAGAATAVPASADTESLFGTDRVASVTYGPYVRAELGYADVSPDGGYWLPPGFDPDPRVNFALSGDAVADGTLAFGFDWQNGWRGEMAFTGTGTSDVSGPCSSASDGSDCATHADIESASVSTRAVMGNVFYAPMEARGSNAVFQPFVTAGLGFATNSVGSWTRVNPDSGRPTRSFEGADTSGLAWSIGAGAAFQVTKPGKWPVIFEAAWRYYDYGAASGGATPLPGNGSEEPVKPLTFDNTQNVLSLGVRIPLKRY